MMVPALPIRPPVIVHHMAALDDMSVPQNSLEAIAACLEAGAAIIELDITALAADDYLLVHDPVLEHETSGDGAVAECTVRQARRLTIRRWGAPTPYRVPLLSEAVALMAAHPDGASLQLDFKNELPFGDDEPLRRLARLIEPLGARVLVSNGADWQLRRLHRLAPWLALGFDVMGYIDWQTPGRQRDPNSHPKQRGVYGYYDDHRFAAMPGWSTADYLADRCESMIGLVPAVNTFYIQHTLIAQSLDDGFNWADALHAHGVRLDAWTMDTINPVAVANAPRLLAAGVDQFTSNTPRALAELLGKG